MRLSLVTKPSATATATTTSGSAVVTVADTSLLAGALTVSGVGIPLGTFVETIDSATELTLTQEATATGEATLTFTLEPVNLAEAKLHLKDILAEENPLVAALITAARQRCELELKRSLIATTWDLFLDCFPRWCARSVRWDQVAEAGSIKIPRPPLIEVDSVNYFDLSGASQIVDEADYLVSTGTPARVAPVALGQWPSTPDRIDAVRIRYTSGYGATAADVPDCIKIAMKLLLSFLHENRGDADAPLPMAVAALLDAEYWGGAW